MVGNPRWRVWGQWQDCLALTSQKTRRAENIPETQVLQRTTLNDPLLSSYSLPTERPHNLEEQRHMLGNKLVKT